MKENNFLPKIEQDELTPIERYAKSHQILREKIVEKYPELDYLQYDEGLLLASPAHFPIIDENGAIGKSYLTNELKRDLTREIIDVFEKENHVEEKELHKFLGLDNRNMTDDEFKYAIFTFRIQKMFRYFEELMPNIDISRFPKEQVYKEIERRHSIDDGYPEDFVAAEKIFANTRMMIEEKMMSCEAADEVLMIALKKAFTRRS